MITLQMMQFTAVVLMLLLTIKLMVPHKRRHETPLATHARWLMATATTVLVVHFLLQLTLGLRVMGVTQSVMLNLTMLIPASYCFSRAVLMLQLHGRLTRWDRWVGPLTWAVVMVMLAVAAVSDGQPLLSDTPELRLAENIGALCYMLMQAYYTWRHTMALRAMHRTLDDYYDRDTDGMLRWMQLSIVGLMLLALMVPMAIFGSGSWMLTIAFAIYFFIFYLVDSFCYYLTSNASARMQEAEENANEEIEEQKQMDHVEQTASKADERPINNGIMQQVEQAVAAWMGRKGYLRSGITQPIAASEIGIPKYQLTAWLHSQGMTYNRWLAELRIEEAKHVLSAHHEWNIDAVADYCGFTDRTTLHRKFKELVGMTPAEWQGQHVNISHK